MADVVNETSERQNVYGAVLPRWNATWPAASPSAGNVCAAVNGYVRVVACVPSGAADWSSTVRYAPPPSPTIARTGVAGSVRPVKVST